MKRIVMTGDCSVDIPGVRAKMHFHGGREYVLPDEFAGFLIEKLGKARLFDAAVKSQITIDTTEAIGRQARLTRIRRDFDEVEERKAAQHVEKKRELIALRSIEDDEAGEQPQVEPETASEECEEWHEGL
ncbi:MAG: hypothetical protein AMJ46_12625 [Latescibacteria bacterium DG_63]|nr:MAG: hypothetical protein AMJ46_12625 [Latescibacteria bacterium DG_63]